MNKFVYTLIDTFFCAVKWWFIVGLIIGIIFSISAGHFNIIDSIGVGFAFFLYPIFGCYLFFMANDSGTQQAFVNSIVIFGSLAFIYILIPLVILARKIKANK